MLSILTFLSCRTNILISTNKRCPDNLSGEHFYINGWRSNQLFQSLSSHYVATRAGLERTNYQSRLDRFESAASIHDTEPDFGIDKSQSHVVCTVRLLDVAFAFLIGEEGHGGFLETLFLFRCLSLFLLSLPPQRLRPLFRFL